MILLFVEEISTRLIYTLDFVFKERGLEYTLTNDFNEFENAKVHRLNYSERYFDGILQFPPASLLFDEELTVYGIGSGTFHTEKCLTFNDKVDPLASVFYILSRMEEYMTTAEDEHGRFTAENSVLSRFGWLQKAMCDRWAVDFLSFLHLNGLVEFQNKEHNATILPTFDIDNVFAYQLKHGFRKILSSAKDLMRGDRFRMNERKLVLQGTTKDPYDTYDYILSIADRGFSVNMFWLLGDYAKYDKNVSFKDTLHQRLIRKMAIKTTVGIHPSYKSNSYEYFLLNEKERLEFILNQSVEHSRQHFLKLKLPATYRSISTMGIKHDYTMGYADQVGFRAGTARSFPWFDLRKNSISDLTIHPFAYMDGTLQEYLKLTPSESKLIIASLFEEVKNYGGDFQMIWHNETFGDYGKWNGWKEVLEFTLDLNKTENG
jgi:hypothetical protein